jgi:hypothetical protein
MNNAKLPHTLSLIFVIGLVLLMLVPAMLNRARASKPEATEAETLSADNLSTLKISAGGCTAVSFSQPAGSPIGVGLAPDSVAVGDLNLDGKPDLAVTNESSNNVTILLGNGSGGFSQLVGSPVITGNQPQHVVVEDFDLDGKPDLAVANLDNTLTIHLGNGSGGFTQSAGSPVAVGNNPRSLAIGDFNSDGKSDLAAANLFSNNVTILVGNGSGGFTQPAGSPVAVGTYPQSVVVGEFNQDGKLDLAVANTTSNNVTILLGDGSGGFNEPADSPINTGAGPAFLAVGDLNLDGRIDLASANANSNSLTILLGNGSGGFTQAGGSPIGVGLIPVSVSVGDFNLDGKPDLAIANGGSTNVTILLGNGSGGFFQSAGSPVSGGSVVGVGDFNLDGKPDLAVANYNTNNLTIQLNSCNAFPCSGMGFSQPAGSPIDLGSAHFSVTVADFNLDGKADLTMADPYSNNLTILLGNGSGGFTEPAGSPVSAGASPRSIAIGDFNLDGKADMAVTNVDSDNVTILLGNGSGGFTQAAGSPIGVGDFPNSIAVGDFNRDGRADLAVANAHSNNVTILLGNGSGGFTQAAGSPVSAGQDPFSVVVADFNLDGIADLATANYGSTNTTILLGNGSGGFTQPMGSPVVIGLNAHDVAVGDFNRDGKPDLAVAIEGSGHLTILLGNGSGGFTQAMGSPVVVGESPRSVDVGDFDLDGKADLAVRNAYSHDLTILLGNGSGGFTQPIGSPIGNLNYGTSVAVADFNLDGKADLAVPDPVFLKLRILLNTCAANIPISITCPTNITTVTNQSLCAPAGQVPCQVVNFPPPIVSDQSQGVTVVCSPASGSCFPTGTTTVNCTATNSSGNTASCSFTVTVFDVCLQDDSNANAVLLFNSFTGDYRFCINGSIFTGKGRVTRLGCSYTLEHNATDRKVLGKIDKSVYKGNASLQSPPGANRCSITDRDTRNNACVCQ